MEEIIKNLKSHNNISDIEDISNIKTYEGLSYEWIFKFNIDINSDKIGIVMAIPINWKKSLIHIYVEKYKNIKYIPHMLERGRICLFDTEGVLIDTNLIGIINESIERINKILVDGINETNKIDFITEFDAYWGLIANRNSVKSIVKIEDCIKKVKYKEYINDSKNGRHIVVADTEKDLDIYKDYGTIKNGIYISYSANEYIYPPDWRNKLDIQYINKILREENINRYVKHCGKEILLIINIKQPNGYNTQISIIIGNYELSLNKINNEFVLYNNCKLTPLSFYRSDKEYLIKRGGIFNDIANKKVLIVGCGSIGGYLISEIVKAGIYKIGLVDMDVLSTDNIYRHILGMEFAGWYKTKAMIRYMKRSIPFVDIKSYEDTIEHLAENLLIDMNEYDLIISATGNHNVNRWLNKFLYENKIDAPAIYLWNEVLGIGNHAIYINRKNKGCFECLIGRSEDGIYDKTSYCERGQSFVKKFNGCCSTFVPFGAIHSLKSVIIAVELVIKYFVGQLNENIIISQKGDDLYFKEEGLKTSCKYKNQINTIAKIEGDKFVNNKCECCKG